MEDINIDDDWRIESLLMQDAAGKDSLRELGTMSDDEADYYKEKK